MSAKIDQSSLHRLPLPDTSGLVCQSYAPGYNVHWIQALHSANQKEVAWGEDERPLGAYPLGVLTTFSEEDVACMPVLKPGPVTPQHRQGVFVHSFKCSICDLEFMVFSWRADRHRVGSTFCPECGRATPMIDWLTRTSPRLDFSSDGPGRGIYQMFSHSDAPLMNDSIIPADHRYTFPHNHTGSTVLGIAADDANGDEHK